MQSAFRFLKAAEFSGLTSAQKSEYLARASQELKRSVDELRAKIAERDRLERKDERVGEAA